MSLNFLEVLNWSEMNWGPTRRLQHMCLVPLVYGRHKNIFSLLWSRIDKEPSILFEPLLNMNMNINMCSKTVSVLPVLFQYIRNQCWFVPAVHFSGWLVACISRSKLFQIENVGILFLISEIAWMYWIGHMIEKQIRRKPFNSWESSYFEYISDCNQQKPLLGFLWRLYFENQTVCYVWKM